MHVLYQIKPIIPVFSIQSLTSLQFFSQNLIKNFNLKSSDVRKLLYIMCKQTLSFWLPKS